MVSVSKCLISTTFDRSTSKNGWVLYDSAGGDTFLGQGPSATLYGAGYFLDLEGYYAVTLYGASGAVNRLHTTILDYLFSTQGDWTAF